MSYRVGAADSVALVRADLVLVDAVVKSLGELVGWRERVDSSYVSRMGNLTTPASAIVAAVLNKTFPPDLTLFDLAIDPPAL